MRHRVHHRMDLCSTLTKIAEVTTRPIESTIDAKTAKITDEFIDVGSRSTAD